MGKEFLPEEGLLAANRLEGGGTLVLPELWLYENDLEASSTQHMCEHEQSPHLPLQP